MMEDEHTLMEITRKSIQIYHTCYLDIAWVLSSLNFISKYGDELTAVTLCGTMRQPWPDLQASIDSLKKYYPMVRVGSPDPTVAGSLIGWMCFARCDESDYGNEWICKDPYVQRSCGRSLVLRSLQLIKRFYTSPDD